TVVATFSANAGTQVLFQQDSSYGSYYYARLQVFGPSNETVAYVYLGNDQFVILPRSGMYAIKMAIDPGYSTVAPYRFQLRDVASLPVMDPSGPTTVPPHVTNDVGSNYQIQGNPGDQVWLDSIPPDNYNDLIFNTNLQVSAYDPSLAEGVLPNTYLNTSAPM